jgi:hypothetical protein
MVRSTKSKKKTVATVTGELVVQYPIANADAARVAFPEAIDALVVIRRTGAVTEKSTPTGFLELRCGVEYGPVLGAYESDLRRQLVNILERTDASHGAVFGSRRREITTDDLAKYGFLPELLGRLPVRVELQELTPADLVSILTEPREAMIPEYQRLCALDQIQLDFSREALFEIAAAAVRQHLGARALRAILEKVLHPILFVGQERAGERIVPDAVQLQLASVVALSSVVAVSNVRLRIRA